MSDLKQIHLRTLVIFIVENGTSRTTHSDDKGKAVCLNEYFSSVFLRDSNITADIQTDNQSNESTNTDEPNLSPIIITKEMIAKKLQNLKPDKAASLDNIFPRILIECQYELLTVHWVIFFFTALRLNIYMWPTKKGTLTHLQLLSF